MQSGISVSQELHLAFNDLVSSPRQRGIIAAIKAETLVPQSSIPASSDFLSDLSSLAPVLSESQATYIILRRHDNAADGYVAVTYVPDSASVRQKMLFASTRLTLVRELGTERFREQVFVTEQKELTKEGWERHEASGALKAPLTEEEETLKGVKDAEAEARGGTGGRQLETGGKLTMAMTDEARTSLESLKENPAGTLVQLVRHSLKSKTYEDAETAKSIDIKTEKIELVDTRSVNAEALSSSISEAAPRYSFYNYSHTSNGSEQVSLIFIYTCPSGSKVKERMLYAASKRALVAGAESDIGLEVAKKVISLCPAHNFGPDADQRRSLSYQVHLNYLLLLWKTSFAQKRQ